MNLPKLILKNIIALRFIIKIKCKELTIIRANKKVIKMKLKTRRIIKIMIKLKKMIKNVQ